MVGQRSALEHKVQRQKALVAEAVQVAKGVKGDMVAFIGQVVEVVEDLRRKNRNLEGVVDGWVTHLKKEEMDGWQPRTIKVLHDNAREVAEQLRFMGEQLHTPPELLLSPTRFSFQFSESIPPLTFPPE